MVVVQNEEIIYDVCQYLRENDLYLISEYSKNSIGIKNGINRVGGSYDKKTPLIKLVSSRKCNVNILKYLLKLPNINVKATYQEAMYDDNNVKTMGDPLTASQICQNRNKNDWAEMINKYKPEVV